MSEHPLPPADHILRPHHFALLSIFVLAFKEFETTPLPSPFLLHVYRLLLNEVSEARCFSCATRSHTDCGLLDYPAENAPAASCRTARRSQVGRNPAQEVHLCVSRSRQFLLLTWCSSSETDTAPEYRIGREDDRLFWQFVHAIHSLSATAYAPVCC